MDKRNKGVLLRTITAILLLISVSAQAQFNTFRAHHGAATPSVTTSDIVSITYQNAIATGYVYNDGGSTITERGFCWNTSGSPTTSDSKVTSSGTIGTMNETISPLASSTQYYVRAYATNANGTAYGDQRVFTTATSGGTLPTVYTTSPTNVSYTTATSGGNVTSEGSSAVTARGVCWSTSQQPTTADSKTSDGTGTGEFTSSITGLTQGEKYYVRAYATNSSGTAYGRQSQINTRASTTITGARFTITAFNTGLFYSVMYDDQNLPTWRYQVDSVYGRTGRSHPSALVYDVERSMINFNTSTIDASLYVVDTVMISVYVWDKSASATGIRYEFNGIYQSTYNARNYFIMQERIPNNLHTPVTLGWNETRTTYDIGWVNYTMLSGYVAVTLDTYTNSAPDLGDSDYFKYYAKPTGGDAIYAPKLTLYYTKK